MGYAIMRFSKIKSSGGIKACQKHNERERKTENADEEIENLIIHGNENKTYTESFEEITKDIKIRKNGVLAIECFMSASPDVEFFQDREKTIEWANESVDWLKEQFGETNVIKSHLHLDEKTPHLHTFIIPVIERKKKRQLSSYKFLGGSKYRLSEMQTDYHRCVEKFGLDRGIEGSTAKHLDIKQFYTLVNQALEKELPEKEFFETSKAYRKRILEEYQKLYVKYTDLELKNKSLESQLKSKVLTKHKMKVRIQEDIEILKILNKNQALRSFVLDHEDKKQDGKNNPKTQERFSVNELLRKMDIEEKWNNSQQNNKRDNTKSR